jgi:hypothetical protein
MALQALGKITVAAAGTNQRVTTTATRCQSITVQALSTNTGKVFVGTSAMVKATFVGVLAVIPAPSTGVIPSATFSIPLSPAGLNAADIYLDVDTNGEGAIVTVSIQ